MKCSVHSNIAFNINEMHPLETPKKDITHEIHEANRFNACHH